MLLFQTFSLFMHAWFRECSHNAVKWKYENPRNAWDNRTLLEYYYLFAIKNLFALFTNLWEENKSLKNRAIEKFVLWEESRTHYEKTTCKNQYIHISSFYVSAIIKYSAEKNLLP